MSNRQLHYSLNPSERNHNLDILVWLDKNFLGLARLLILVFIFVCLFVFLAMCSWQAVLTWSGGLILHLTVHIYIISSFMLYQRMLNMIEPGGPLFMGSSVTFILKIFYILSNKGWEADQVHSYLSEREFKHFHYSLHTVFQCHTCRHSSLFCFYDFKVSLHMPTHKYKSIYKETSSHLESLPTEPEMSH